MNAYARGAAVFVGAYLALSLAGPDIIHWLVDVRGVPAGLRSAILATAAAVLLAFGLTGRLARSGAIVLAGLAGAALLDALQVAALRHVETGPVSASMVFALALATAARCGMRESWARLTSVFSVAGALAAGFVLVHVGCFGPTDYRRPADAIVVFGARTYASGTPSLALRDRLRTGIELYHAGLAPALVVSGGPGDGVVHETDAMRTAAIEAGVPAEAIVVDRGGVSTRATVAGVTRLLHGSGSVLAVSHGYHMPRVHIAFDRAGLQAFTVPARETRRLLASPYFVAREVAAFWAYATRWN